MAASGRPGYFKRYLRYHFREKAGVVILGGFFLAGLTAGCVSMDFLSQKAWPVLMELCSPPPESRRFVLLMADEFFGMLGLLIFLFLCGFSAIGHFFSVGAIFLKGAGFGLTAAYLYSVSIGAVQWYYLLVVIPKMVMWLAVAIPAARKSIAMSGSFLAAVLPGSRQEAPLPLTQYFGKFFLLCGGAAAYALPTSLLELLYRSIAG